MRRLATLAVIAVLTACPVRPGGEEVSAAPNPVRSIIATHTLRIGADGGYEVEMDQTIDMARTYAMTIGGTVHDGFRLPDTDHPIPPYLRAEYTRPELVLDGQDRDVEIGRTHHAMSIGRAADLDEGEHRAKLSYQVAGAAVSTRDDEMAVHFRPLQVGDVRVTAATSIVSVDCVTIPPSVKPCGTRADAGWTVDADELGRDGELRIRVKVDPADLPEPVIDTGRSDDLGQSVDTGQYDTAPSSTGSSSAPPNSQR